MADYKDPRPSPTASAADPCVIYDNAVSFNEVVNGDADVTTYTGKVIKPLTRMSAPDPVNGGVWASGQEFNFYNEYMIYNGEAYSPLPETTLPYTVGAVPNLSFVYQIKLNSHPALSGRNEYAAHSPTATGSTVARALEDRFADRLNVKDFASLQSALTCAIEGGALYLPSGQYNADALNVATANKKIVIRGDTPSYDPITNIKKGTWINGVLSSAGADSIAMFDVGVDTRLSATNEGVVFSDPQYMDTVFLDRVIVIAKPASNHCLLIENTKRVDVGTVILYGGIQGFAIKSEVFNIGAIFAFDQTTWGCTVRYSPNAPCENGYIGYVYCGTVNNAKGGGVVCMNDQQGAALKNINFGKIIIENGNAGFFITNNANTVSAENITIDDLYIDGVSAFAIQTFGSPNGFKIGRAHLKDCSGSMTHNGGNPQDHEINNLTIENTGAPALLSGANHKLRGWSKKGGSGGTFVQNESTDLQVWDMDARVSAVANQNGGTQYNSGSTAGINYAANGSIPAMIKLTGLKVQKGLSMAQNASVLLYQLPANNELVAMKLQIAVISAAGTHIRTVEIAKDVVTYTSSSASASSVFTVERVGDSINLKYVFSVTSTVYINCSIDTFNEL